MIVYQVSNSTLLQVENLPCCHPAWIVFEYFKLYLGYS